MHEQSPEEEKILIEQAKTDEVAFGRLFDAYYPQIFNYILKRLGHIQTAQDIAAETFYKAFKKRTSFTWRGIPFSAWLYRIAANEINMHARRKPFLSLDTLTVEQNFDVPSNVNIVSELLEAERQLQTRQEILQLREAMNVLPTKYREVLSLRYFAGKKVKEIAEILNKPEGTVKSLLSRGVSMLEENLKAQPISEPSITTNEELTSL